MLILDRLLVGGVRFVLDKLVSAVEQELDDDEPLKERLLQAQMQLELGELDAAEFAAIEAEVMARLRELRERREGPQLGAEGVEIVGIEVEAQDLGGQAAGGATPPRRRSTSRGGPRPKRRSRRKP
jgi:Gas vesicle protein G